MDHVPIKKLLTTNIEICFNIVRVRLEVENNLHRKINAMLNHNYLSTVGDRDKYLYYLHTHKHYFRFVKVDFEFFLTYY